MWDALGFVMESRDGRVAELFGLKLYASTDIKYLRMFQDHFEMY